MRLRKLDKKSEKSAVAVHRARLQHMLETEASPAAALALLVPLLVIKAHYKLVSVPGRAIGGVLALLQPALAEGVHQAVLAFHEAVVESLKLMSQGHQEGSGGAGRLAHVNEGLQAQLPLVREMVLGSDKGGASPRPAQ